jgi:hypothetical protein
VVNVVLLRFGKGCTFSNFGKPCGINAQPGFGGFQRSGFPPLLVIRRGMDKGFFIINTVRYIF